MPEPYRVVTTAEMRALEQAALERGITEAQLQERAGREVAAVAAREAGLPGPRAIVALVGPGNNGRDAMVAARYLAREGYPVALYLTPRHGVRGEELEELRGLGAVWVEHDERGLEQLREWLERAPVAIDGLLGIGVRGAMRAPLAEIAEVVNEARMARRSKPSGALSPALSDTGAEPLDPTPALSQGERERRMTVVSVDVPSGVESDTGQAPGVVVRADVTVVLGAVKAGLLRFPGGALAGRLEPRPIGLPSGLVDELPVRLLDMGQAAALVPDRPLQAHKGSLGKVLVVGGSREYVGAPILAATAAARSGCGIVGLAVPRHLQVAAASRFPEATYALLPGEGAETDTEAAIDAVREVAGRFDALVLGPGLGASAGARRLVHELLQGAWPLEKPAVVDADGLNLLAQLSKWWEGTGGELVLTPHLGEMARLTGESAAGIGQATWETARAWSQRWGQVVVLKSAHTVVADPTGNAWVSPWANPALATAGSGDVLAGLIAGLLVQGVDRVSASRLAVALQAEAAAATLARRGWRTLLASDVAGEIPAALAALARGQSTVGSLEPVRLAAW